MAIGRWAAGLAVLFGVASGARPAAAAFSFKAGDLYSTVEGSFSVYQFDPAGPTTGMIELPRSYGQYPLLHGLAFGPDGLLYVVVDGPTASSPEGNAVLALDGTGAVVQHYPFSSRLGRLSSGGIAFDRAGHFYVGVSNELLRFTVGQPGSAAPFWETAASVNGVEVLPSGDLLVIGYGGVSELDPTTMASRLVFAASDPNGLGYDAAADRVLVSVPGMSTPAHVYRVDRATGVLVDGIEAANPADLLTLADGRTLVGSRTSAFFADADLHRVGSLGQFESIFVAQASVPEPATASLATLVGVGLLGRRRRRA